jgi:hypothetical protein
LKAAIQAKLREDCSLKGQVPVERSLPVWKNWILYSNLLWVARVPLFQPEQTAETIAEVAE